MPTKSPKRPGVSVTKETYERLQAEATRQDTTVNKLVEKLLGSSLRCCAEPLPMRTLGVGEYCMNCKKRLR